VHDILKAKGNIVETIYYPAEGHGFQKKGKPDRFSAPNG
jgi:dipeptidyl aminopeptidase/acylaminoacyl peptidase